jgi:hypothetical protein
MLIYVNLWKYHKKNQKLKKKLLIYVTFMLIYVNLWKYHKKNCETLELGLGLGLSLTLSMFRNPQNKIFTFMLIFW